MVFRASSCHESQAEANSPSNITPFLEEFDKLQILLAGLLLLAQGCLNTYLAFFLELLNKKLVTNLFIKKSK